jgi:hypothetical protein
VSKSISSFFYFIEIQNKARNLCRGMAGIEPALSKSLPTKPRGWCVLIRLAEPDSATRRSRAYWLAPRDSNAGRAVRRCVEQRVDLQRSERRRCCVTHHVREAVTPGPAHAVDQPQYPPVPGHRYRTGARTSAVPTRCQRQQEAVTVLQAQLGRR